MSSNELPTREMLCGGSSFMTVVQHFGGSRDDATQLWCFIYRRVGPQNHAAERDQQLLARSLTYGALRDFFAGLNEDRRPSSMTQARYQLMVNALRYVTLDVPAR